MFPGSLQRISVDSGFEATADRAEDGPEDPVLVNYPVRRQSLPALIHTVEDDASGRGDSNHLAQPDLSGIENSFPSSGKSGEVPLAPRVRRRAGPVEEADRGGLILRRELQFAAKSPRPPIVMHSRFAHEPGQSDLSALGLGGQVHGSAQRWRCRFRPVRRREPGQIPR